MIAMISSIVNNGTLLAASPPLDALTNVAHSSTGGGVSQRRRQAQRGSGGVHIAINGMFWGEPRVGSGQYLRGLLDGLRHVAPGLRLTLITPDAGGVPVPAAIGHVPARLPALPAGLAKVWFEQVAVPRLARNAGADLLHVPYFAPPWHSTVPCVTTILDVIPLRFAAYRRSLRVRAYLRLVAAAAPRVRRVIAISEASRRDILLTLRLPAGCVSTTLLAAAPHYHPIADAAAQLARSHGIERPFIYYVGGYDQRKSVDTLIAAFAQGRRSGAHDLDLVLAGGPPGRGGGLFAPLDDLIAASGVARHIRRVAVSDAENALFYSAATICAYPSRYEGFGLPPLEALACGAACLVSDAASLREVVGDAALIAPAGDVAAWAAALARLAGDAALRVDLGRRGRQRAAQFDYRRTAQQTLAIYQELRCAS